MHNYRDFGHYSSISGRAAGFFWRYSRIYVNFYILHLQIELPSL